MKNTPLSKNAKQKLGNFSIIAGVALLMILIGVQHDEIEEAPLRVPDRLTYSQFQQETSAIVAERDAERAALFAVVCRKFPDEPECADYYSKQEN